MNHGLRTYQSSCRSFTLIKKKILDDDDEITVLPISIPDSIKDHSRNSVSYPKSLRIQAFKTLESFKMYYAIGASISSLHRESTDSLIII